MRTETFSATLRQLPLEKTRRIGQIRDHQSKLQSIIGLKLLGHGFVMLGLRKFHLKKLAFSHNKPELYNGWHFSISHSHNCICCVISKNSPVGIDVEKIRELPINLAKKYQLQQPNISAIVAWTRKEAVLKVHSEDKLGELKEINLIDNLAHFKNRQYHINSFTLEKKYSISIARNQPNTKIKIKRVYF